ncbi:MAG: hypothetical protein H7X88_07890 [Gloeobacteraceae cyanobacterium ES-bin-316]|nr:hypothetical protein [Ferruginibacter sp.]
MKRAIHIFKSIREQEEFHLQWMKDSSVEDRFKRLLQMQAFSLLLHPPNDKISKIKIQKWTS